MTSRSRESRRSRRPLILAFAGLGAAGLFTIASAGAPPTVLDLQPFRDSQTISLPSRGTHATATLIDLNPEIGVWYVLKIDGVTGSADRTYHLENPRPRSQKLRLDAQRPALLIADGPSPCRCEVFDAASADRIDVAGASRMIFQPLCGSRLYVRNSTTGRHTRLEAAADFVRERVWGGENLLALGHHVLGDSNRETGVVGAAAAESPGHAAKLGPLPALVDSGIADRTVTSENLGISVASQEGRLTPGAWYAATGSPGVYVSVLQPGMVAGQILRGGEKSVSALDSVESSALCYLVAFDLSRLELGFASGTEHPSVGWSDHMLAQMRDAARPGPDGIATIAPLVATGLVNPDEALRTVAAFTGGFKRQHAAFRYGELATKNHGSHYGVVENGTVLSTLQPGLATLIVWVDGRVDLQTWSDADRAQLRHIRYARQNGVPIVEIDQQSQATIPGRLVNQWGPGNWSGSEDLKLRTIRSAAAIQRRGDRSFLIYAVFSSATPSAMARVFQAYQCRYAMLLDMNALEHTYLALHRRVGSRIVLEHLIKGMSVLDRASKGETIPRFVGYPDNRDFFYVMQRTDKGHP